MTLSWTLLEAAQATGGTVFGDPATHLAGVSTDSRAVRHGDLFVAVAGTTSDGHGFVDGAIDHGAAAVLVRAGMGIAAEPRVEVGDTTVALRDLATHRRGQLDVAVVAITGSTGKTTTKDLLASALPGVYAAPRSFNNEFGVPLTVLSAPDSARYLVAEVGSRGAGDIEYLMPAVKPDVAIITNLGLVHLETFGTTDRLADAKWELVAGLGRGGVAVLPADEPRLRRAHEGSTVTFGVDYIADVMAYDVELDDAGRPRFRLMTPDDDVEVRLAMAGRHNAANAAAAVAAAIGLDVDLETILPGLEEASGSPWRMEIHRGRYTVVNDAYNANPDSVAAALETVAAMSHHPIAVLGLMAELGHVAEAEHRRIGALAVELGFRAVVTVGDDPGIALGAGSIAHPVADDHEAAVVLKRIIEPNDVVLVKASRAVGLERLAAALIEESAS
ncbi:MAG TPA: UDP-N-acetylmuramoyl-tripeptide--D-alanyl-D-alanine ligase [Acidimicrobiia bacterium]